MVSGAVIGHNFGTLEDKWLNSHDQQNCHPVGIPVSLSAFKFKSPFKTTRLSLVSYPFFSAIKSCIVLWSLSCLEQYRRSPETPLSHFFLASSEPTWLETWVFWAQARHNLGSSEPPARSHVMVWIIVRAYLQSSPEHRIFRPVTGYYYVPIKICQVFGGPGRCLGDGDSE